MSERVHVCARARTREYRTLSESAKICTDTGRDPHQNLRATESELSSIQTTLSSIPGIECRRFRHVAAQIRRCGDLSVKLAVTGIDMVTLTDFSVEEAHLRRCPVAFRKPVEVKTADSYCQR